MSVCVPVWDMSDILIAYLKKLHPSLNDQQLRELMDASPDRRARASTGAGLRSPGVSNHPTSTALVIPARRRRPVPVLPELVRRRRIVAAAGLLPPNLAWHYSPGELAAISIVVDRCRSRGYCDLFIEQIQCMAGVSRKTVQNAIRLAVRLGHVSCQTRPAQGRGFKKHRSNVIRIVSRELQAWVSKRKGRVTPASDQANRSTPMITRIQEGLPEGSLPSRLSACDPSVRSRTAK